MFLNFVLVWVFDVKSLASTRLLCALLCLALAAAVDTQFASVSPLTEASPDSIRVLVDAPQSKAVQAPRNDERVHTPMHSSAKAASILPRTTTRTPGRGIEKFLDFEAASIRNPLGERQSGRSPPCGLL